MKRFLIVPLFILLWVQSVGSPIDSLRQVIESAETDSSRADAMLQLSWNYSKINLDSGIYFALTSLDLCKRKNDAKRHGKSLRFLAINYRKKGEYEKSLKALFEALEIEKKRKDFSLAASTLLGIGNNYYEQNKLSRAEKYWNDAIKYYRKTEDSSMTAAVLSNLGALKSEQQLWSEALDYYRKSMEIDRNLNNNESLAGTMVNMGDIYLHMDSTESALNSAEVWFQEALQIYSSMDDRTGEAAVLLSMAQLESQRNQFRNAEKYAHRALDAYRTIANRIRENECYEVLYKIMQSKGDHKKAFQYLHHYLMLKDSILNESSSQQINELNIRYETAEKEKKLAEQQLEITKQSDEIYIKNFIGIALIIGVLMLVGLSIVTYLRFQDKQKANMLISEQKRIVDKQNANILSGLSYARNIQSAILPSHQQFKALFADYFILYQPRDIVSGDFYWLHETDQYTILAIADCTGHGVPGAFMSVLGVSLLNEIIIENDVLETDLILNELRDKIIKSLKQKDNDTRNDDGMDISIIRIDRKTLEMEFSGTSMPLLVLRNGKAESLQPDFQSISYLPVPQPDFTKLGYSLKKGDSIYLFTDGYVDQVGGPQSRKFGMAPLVTLLEEHHADAMENQCTTLHSSITKWIEQGNLKQMDDICIVGLRV